MSVERRQRNRAESWILGQRSIPQHAAQDMATGDAEWLWLAAAPWREPNAAAIDERGVQIPPLHYPHLSHTEIFELLQKLLQAVLLSPPKDRPARRRNDHEPANDAPMDGLQLARTVVEVQPHLPVNYTTGGDETDRLTV